MLNLSFHPNETSSPLEKATEEYRNIWEHENERILKSLRATTNLAFPDNTIEVVVYEGISKSGSESEPMMLRASYSSDTKTATLIHELGHRLLDIHHVQIPKDLDVHQLLNLFLYDVWVDLYGTQFANEQVEIEKLRNERYLKSWEWALAMKSEDRKTKFTQIVRVP